MRVQSFSQDRFSVMSWEVEPPNETQHALGLVTHPQLFAPPEHPLPCAVVSCTTNLSSGTELSEMQSMGPSAAHSPVAVASVCWTALQFPQSGTCFQSKFSQGWSSLLASAVIGL